MSLPATMRHVVIREPGPPEALVAVTAPVPRPRPGEVLIEVAWAGVNRPDCMQRAGKYPPPPDASPIPGLEVSGRVVALGEGVERPRVGEPVCALVAGGGYAEYALAPADWCLPVPHGCSLRDAAGLPETTFTVWNNLVDRASLAAGEVVLIHGGTSGIGLAAIQIAKARGATVVATAGTPDKVAFCRSIGADHAIDYRATDFVAEVARLTDRRGVDVVLDMVGGDYVPRNLACLADDGRLSIIGLQQGPKAEIDFRRVLLKRLTISGSTLRASPHARKAAIARDLAARVWPLVESGALRVVVDSVHPLDRAADAHARMEGGEHIGKILLAVRG